MRGGSGRGGAGDACFDSPSRDDVRRVACLPLRAGRKLVRFPTGAACSTAPRGWRIRSSASTNRPMRCCAGGERPFGGSQGAGGRDEAVRIAPAEPACPARGLQDLCLQPPLGRGARTGALVLDRAARMLGLPRDWRDAPPGSAGFAAMEPAPASGCKASSPRDYLDARLGETDAALEKLDPGGAARPDRPVRRREAGGGGEAGRGGGGVTARLANLIILRSPN